MAPAASAGNHGGNQGLYDSHYEHDACGVGFVADLSGRRTHDTMAQALTVLRNLDHRGAKGSDPETGDGAGILTQIPDAFFRDGLRVRPARRRLSTRRAWPSCPPARPPPRRAMAAVERIAAAEGPGRPRLAGGPARPRVLRAGLAGGPAPAGPAVRRGPGHRGERAGPGPAGVLPAQARRARGRAVLREPVLADDRLQGDADRAPAGAVLPRPVRPRVHLGPGHGALPVLHQHLPVLAAGPPVPVHRAQRRDQHRAGQPQLDAGPGGDARHRPHPPAADGTGGARDAGAWGWSGSSPSWTTTPATRPASTSAWNCCIWAAARCRTPSS